MAQLKLGKNVKKLAIATIIVVIVLVSYLGSKFILTKNGKMEYFFHSTTEALNLIKSECGVYPSTLDVRFDNNPCVQRYSAQIKPGKIDPWGKPYSYIAGEDGFRLVSPGGNKQIDQTGTISDFSL